MNKKHIPALAVMAMALLFVTPAMAGPCDDDLEESFSYQTGNGIGTRTRVMPRQDTVRVAQAYGEELSGIILREHANDNDWKGANEFISFARTLVTSDCFKPRFLLGYRDGRRVGLDHVDAARDAFVDGFLGSLNKTPPVDARINGRQTKETATPFH